MATRTAGIFISVETHRAVSHLLWKLNLVFSPLASFLYSPGASVLTATADHTDGSGLDGDRERGPLTELHQCVDEAQEGDHEVEHKHSLQLQLHPRCHGTLSGRQDDSMRHDGKHYKDVL